MKFLNDEQNRRFEGTKERDASGDTLDEFLEKYDPSKYLNPSNTVDMLIFTYAESEGVRRLSGLLLIKRRNHPCIGMWATPGGFIEFRESIEDAAARELEEETGIKGIELEQLGSYGDYDRDPRTRVITTAYVALVHEGDLRPRAGDDAKDARWFDIQWTQGGEVRHGDGRISVIQQLTLTSKDETIRLGATVKKSWRESSVLKGARYELLNSDGIAADHGAIIMEAAEYVKGKL